MIRSSSSGFILCKDKFFSADYSKFPNVNSTLLGLLDSKFLIRIGLKFGYWLKLYDAVGIVCIQI